MPARANPHGSKPKGWFKRCVSAVKKRGGAYDPNAVCGAIESRGNPSLKGILKDRYGVSLDNAPPYAILWSAEKLAEQSGVTKARKELAAANRYRERRGLVLAYPPYGSALFDKRRRNAIPVLPADVVSGIEGALGGTLGTTGLKSVQKATGLKLNRGKKKRRNPRNPEGAAAAAYEGFHGQPSTEQVRIDQQMHYHEHVFAAGELIALRIIPFQAQHEVIVKGLSLEGQPCFLTSNEERNQLFIDGGDQRVNLRDFGITGPVHESEELGELKRIEYYTTKDHLGKDGGEAVYHHTFSKPRPSIVYDTRNGLLYIVGGKYTVEDEGITN